MITIYTKNHCPYCHKSLDLLDKLGMGYKNINLDENPELYAELRNISGMQTVPQIFDGEPTKENLIGGSEELFAKYA